MSSMKMSSKKCKIHCSSRAALLGYFLADSPPLSSVFLDKISGSFYYTAHQEVQVEVVQVGLQHRSFNIGVAAELLNLPQTMKDARDQIAAAEIEGPWRVAPGIGQQHRSFNIGVAAELLGEKNQNEQQQRQLEITRWLWPLGTTSFWDSFPPSPRTASSTGNKEKHNTRNKAGNKQEKPPASMTSSPSSRSSSTSVQRARAVEQSSKGGADTNEHQKLDQQEKSEQSESQDLLAQLPDEEVQLGPGTKNVGTAPAVDNISDTTTSSADDVSEDGVSTSSLSSAGAASSTSSPSTTVITSIADVHGDFATTVKALQLANIIDANHDWIAGTQTLVQNGDVVDRGNHAREIYDLLFKLQDQAAAAGGKVVLILGNHEQMRMQGILKYQGRHESSWAAQEENKSPEAGEQEVDAPGAARPVNKILSAKENALAGEKAWAPGGWLHSEIERRFTAMAVVGKSLYLHASLQKVFLEELNYFAREVVVAERRRARQESSEVGGLPLPGDQDDESEDSDEDSDSLYSYPGDSEDLPLPLSPNLREKVIQLFNENTFKALRYENDDDGENYFWVDSKRSVFWSRDYAAECDLMGEIAEFFGVKRIIGGHTIQKDGLITSKCDGQIILADTALSSAYWNAYPRGQLSLIRITAEDGEEKTMDFLYEDPTNRDKSLLAVPQTVDIAVNMPARGRPEVKIIDVPEDEMEDSEVSDDDSSEEDDDDLDEDVEDEELLLPPGTATSPRPSRELQQEKINHEPSKTKHFPRAVLLEHASTSPRPGAAAGTKHAKARNAQPRIARASNVLPLGLGAMKIKPSSPKKPSPTKMKTPRKDHLSLKKKEQDPRISREEQVREGVPKKVHQPVVPAPLLLPRRPSLDFSEDKKHPGRRGLRNYVDKGRRQERERGSGLRKNGGAVLSSTEGE